MQRIDASKLMTLLLSPESKAEMKLILCDNPVFKKVLSDKIFEDHNYRPALFEGKTAFKDYSNSITQCGMFSLPQKSI